MKQRTRNFTNCLFPFQWLCVINSAVIYNLIFVIGRSVFWNLENSFSTGWIVLDYLCDALYVADIIIRMHEGKE